jgi:hypothetical protein
MRKNSIFLAVSLFLALIVAGCGGGNGGNGFGIIDNFVGDASGAIETANLSRLSTLISPNYLDNCFDKTDVLNAYRDIFNDPDIDSIDVQTTEISDRRVNGDFARFFWGSRITIYYFDGTHTTTSQAGYVYLIRQNGLWREYGNQSCNGAAKTTGDPLNGRMPLREAKK